MAEKRGGGKIPKEGEEEEKEKEGGGAVVVVIGVQLGKGRKLGRWRPLQSSKRCCCFLS